MSQTFAVNEMSGMTEGQSSPRIYIDTNIFIGAFEAESDQARDLRLLFERFRKQPKTAVTSELTLAELAVQQGPGRRFYMGLIIFSNFIDLLPVTRDILLKTADYRAITAVKQKGSKTYGKLLDAIHCVTAVRSRCEFVLSADQRFHVPQPLRRVAPNANGLTLIYKALDA